jgi:hypothetical protein
LLGRVEQRVFGRLAGAGLRHAGCQSSRAVFVSAAMSLPGSE